MEGTYVAVSKDTLLLQTETQTTPSAIPLTSVSRLEVSRGRKSNVLKGMGIGMLIGAGVGVIGGAAVDCYDLADFDQSFCTGVGAAGGALFGLLVGAIAGAASSGDRWEEVPLDRLRLQVAQQHDGRFKLGLSVAF
jgi:hypothetical protein